jgi:hypothetical protein
LSSLLHAAYTLLTLTIVRICSTSSVLSAALHASKLRINLLPRDSRFLNPKYIYVRLQKNKSVSFHCLISRPDVQVAAKPLATRNALPRV